jgi:radical SAM superfamily enzyme YgiQ (UPF0313 family)
VRFARRTRLETVQFLVLTPLPGTPFFDELKEQERLGIPDYSFYDAHHVVFEPAQMSPYELQREVIRGHAKFYSVARILGEMARFRLFEAMVKIYGRRISVRFQRLSGWFVEGLERGFGEVCAMLEAEQAAAAT